MSFRTGETPSVTAGPPQSATPMQVGDKVEITAGRHRGSKGTLSGVVVVEAPSGSTYRIVEVKRPRAGATFAFEHEVRKLP